MSKPKVLIIGDSCIDRYISCRVDRICPEGPVPVAVPIEVNETSGMAGNVYENALRYNELVLNDRYDIHFVTNEETVIKTRYVDSKTQQLILRVDEGDSDVLDIPFDVLNKIMQDDWDGVLVSDYDKGFLDGETLHTLGMLPNSIIDTKKIFEDYDKDWVEYYSRIKINFKEALNNGFNTNSTDPSLIITDGENGTWHKGERYPVEKIEVKDLTGAGDTFMATFGLAYINEPFNVEKAIREGNKMATKVVQKYGTSVI